MKRCMEFDFDSLSDLVDRYFEFYVNNPVPTCKLEIEISCWLSVNFIFGFISSKDLSLAIRYVSKKLNDRRKINGI